MSTKTAVRLPRWQISCGAERSETVVGNFFVAFKYYNKITVHIVYRFLRKTTRYAILSSRVFKIDWKKLNNKIRYPVRLNYVLLALVVSKNNPYSNYKLFREWHSLRKSYRTPKPLLRGPCLRSDYVLSIKLPNGKKKTLISREIR